MKKIYNATKNAFNKNKTTFVVGTIATLAAVVVIQHTGIKSLNEFLKDKDLYKEYYLIDLFEDQN